MKNTTIAWTHATFNPWIGCSKVAPECAACYAEKDMDLRRHRVKWGPQGTRSRTSDAYWRQPIAWNREAEKAGERRRVFCASLADVFEDWNGPILGSNKTPLHDGKAWRSSQKYFEPGLWIGKSLVTMNDLRRDLFALIDATPHLDWLLLTKRPENIRKMWVPHDFERDVADNERIGLQRHLADALACTRTNFRDNVWLMTSAGSQKTADKMVLELMNCRDLVPILGVSAEPLLEETHLDRLSDGKNGWVDCLGGVWGHGFSTDHEGDGTECIPDGITGDKIIDWVICGCESSGQKIGRLPGGTEEGYWNAVRSLKEQCFGTSTAFFHKQAPLNGKVSHDPAEWPRDLRVREMPERKELAAS